MYIIFENNKLGLGGGGSDCHYVKRSFQATVLIINFLKHQPTRMISHGDPRLSVPRLLVAWLCQSNQRIISKQGNNVKGFLWQASRSLFAAYGLCSSIFLKVDVLLFTGSFSVLPH